MSQFLSFPKEKINILLLEGIHSSAVEVFNQQGYTSIESLPKALDGEELEQSLQNVHFLGIRSRTQLSKEIISAAPKLLSIGCFCIGTNQVDLEQSRLQGIPVFNAPHSNTRSVAELVLAEMIMLYRGLGDKSRATHEGRWLKSAKNSFEVRGKTLGIIGYGHIGSQLSILAEAFGLKVLYYDIVPKLPMGNANQTNSLDELLSQSDFISLHVPAAEGTVNLISEREIKKMKKSCVFINASRGNVVDIDALAKSLKNDQLLGAAIDVFPKEPSSAEEKFVSPLQGLQNVILTPHIGGSTMEAQVNIGKEVANKLIQYSDEGSTTGSVNFPSITLPTQSNQRHRLLHMHKNQPGVLSAINQILAESKTNILGQYLQTFPDVGYVVIEVDQGQGQELHQQLTKIPGTIRCRILH